MAFGTRLTTDKFPLAAIFRGRLVLQSVPGSLNQFYSSNALSSVSDDSTEDRQTSSPEICPETSPDISPGDFPEYIPGGWRPLRGTYCVKPTGGAVFINSVAISYRCGGFFGVAEEIVM